MKTARLLVVLLNFALIGLVAFAGVRFYTHTFDEDDKGTGNFFKEHDLPTFDPGKVLRKKPEKPVDTYENYRWLADLAKAPPAPVVEVEELPTAPEQLRIQVNSVVYNRNDPAKSGAHITANNVPRYISVGDNRQISKEMPYTLKEIREDKPKLEYTLVFEDSQGEPKQARYIRK